MFKNDLKTLRNKIDGNVHDSTIIRTLYSTDASMFKIMPTLVCEPKNENDLYHLLDFAKNRGLPVAPRGAGTGLAGESLTSGIVVDFSVFMNDIKKN